jgi:hypothetical protein
MIQPKVLEAIEEVKALFPGHVVDVQEDGEGGAYVTVEGVDPGPVYLQRQTWIGFRIGFQYPYCDVYPHYVRGDLTRLDGRPLGEGTSLTTFLNRSAVQLSRRSNRWDPATDTAALKLLKVLKWLENHP